MNEATSSCPLIFTEKFVDVMSITLDSRCRVFVHEGTTQSGKTASAITPFFEAVQDSDEELHLIGAWDLNAIQDKLLNKKDIGLFRLYDNYCRLKKDEIGSHYVNVKCDIVGKPKWKKILLSGFADKSKWKNILGKTLGCILIDEVNTANEDFINECFSRQVAVKQPKQIWTLNGDKPSHWVYQKYINHCKIIDKHLTPASIIAEMNRFDKKQGWYYLHWQFRDNPILSEEQIIYAFNLYPKGSFYHTTKILGERGTPGKLIYLDYFNSNLIKKIVSKPKHELLDNEVSIRDYQRFIIGCDIGSTRAKNSYTLTGFSYDYSKMAFITKITFENVGYKYKAQQLEQFTKLWLSRNLNIEVITIDSAEANYIRDLQTEFLSKALPEVVGSYKATIKERIDAMIILASAGRVIFNDTEEGRDLYDAFLMAKWVDGKEGIEREDLNEPHNDKIDSAEYSFTPCMVNLMRYDR